MQNGIHESDYFVNNARTKLYTAHNDTHILTQEPILFNANAYTKFNF